MLELFLNKNFGPISEKQEIALKNMQTSNKELLDLVQIVPLLDDPALVTVLVVPTSVITGQTRRAPRVALGVVIQPEYRAMYDRVLSSAPVVYDHGPVVPEGPVPALCPFDIALDLGLVRIPDYDDVAGVYAAYLGLVRIVLHALRHDYAEGGCHPGVDDKAGVTSDEDDDDDPYRDQQVPISLVHEPLDALLY